MFSTEGKWNLKEVLAGVEINNRRDPILLGFIDTKYNIYTHLQLMCFGINKYMYKAFSLLHLYSSRVNSNVGYGVSRSSSQELVEGVVSIGITEGMHVHVCNTNYSMQHIPTIFWSFF